MCLSSPRSTTHPIQSTFKARAFHLPITFLHLPPDLRSVHFNATLPVYWDLQTNQKLETEKHNHFSSCCPLWRAISSVSEVKMLKLLKQKFIMLGS
ncbi:hypothetical protein L3X38_013413 [Prunus dulcis]|uniref:Uncharacterized protein n=1 Tax=Prunus dulcis TaxID=3755 RepID=A0AAD4WLW3_PRUDU|nr:hypothetical protein L3X38_013413 [Prunus dulcis]